MNERRVHAQETSSRPIQYTHPQNSASGPFHFLPTLHLSTCLITAFQDHLNWTMTLSFSAPAPGYPGCSQRFSSRNSLSNSLYPKSCQTLSLAPEIEGCTRTGPWAPGILRPLLCLFFLPFPLQSPSNNN